MISIIIASANDQHLQAVLQNIAQTIGVPYEVITYNNSEGEKGLCTLYNQGAAEAKYELLCYMHEDLDIKTPQWGNIVVRLFEENPKLGIAGVAGSSYKTQVPSAWFCDAGPKPVNFVNILQRFKFEESATKHNYVNPGNAGQANVVLVDGVWFCTRRPIVRELPFDAQTFKGFHCYDLDFSMAVSMRYDAIVTFDVLLEHFSEGNYNAQWVEETLKLQQKWALMLPLNNAGLNKKEVALAEKYTFRFFLSRLKQARFSRKMAFQSLLRTRMQFKNPVLFLVLLKEVIRYRVK